MAAPRPEHHSGYRLTIRTPETVCFFVLCNRHRFNRIPGPPPRDELGCTHMHPSPLAQTLAMRPTPNLIGSPSRHRGSFETRITVSWGRTPGNPTKLHLDDHRYLIYGRNTGGGNRIRGHLSPWPQITYLSVKSHLGIAPDHSYGDLWWTTRYSKAYQRERVLFIGTQFSNLYTAVDTPARGRVGSISRCRQTSRRKKPRYCSGRKSRNANAKSSPRPTTSF
jgi:hypothetical protein